jgi:hypothetical protein
VFAHLIARCEHSILHRVHRDASELRDLLHGVAERVTEDERGAARLRQLGEIFSDAARQGLAQRRLGRLGGERVRLRLIDT